MPSAFVHVVSPLELEDVPCRWLMFRKMLVKEKLEALTPTWLSSFTRNHTSVQQINLQHCPLVENDNKKIHGSTTQEWPQNKRYPKESVGCGSLRYAPVWCMFMIILTI